MTYTEFWTRLEQALGATYFRLWADQHVLGDLGDRTPVQALDAGTSPREVWRAVWRDLQLPDHER